MPDVIEILSPNHDARALPVTMLVLHYTGMPDAAFALHVMPNAPHGLFAGRGGPLMASSDVIKIKVSGKGGHASMPHDAVDPIPVACAIVSAIQMMVTRRVSVFDPAVVTIAKIVAGTTNNIIPEVALMEGTVRTLSAHQRAHAGCRIPAALVQGAIDIGERGVAPTRFGMAQKRERQHRPTFLEPVSDCHARSGRRCDALPRRP